MAHTRGYVAQETQLSNVTYQSAELGLQLFVANLVKRNWALHLLMNLPPLANMSSLTNPKLCSIQAMWADFDPRDLIRCHVTCSHVWKYVWMRGLNVNHCRRSIMPDTHVSTMTEYHWYKRTPHLPQSHTLIGSRKSSSHSSFPQTAWVACKWVGQRSSCSCSVNNHRGKLNNDASQ